MSPTLRMVWVEDLDEDGVVLQLFTKGDQGFLLVRLVGLLMAHTVVF